MKHTFFYTAALAALLLVGCTGPIKEPVPQVAEEVKKFEERVEQKVEQAEERVEQDIDRIEKKIEGTAEELRETFHELTLDARLDRWAFEHLFETGEALDWRESCVDLIKLLGWDSSKRARREWARLFGIKHYYTGSARDNIALHRAIIRLLTFFPVRSTP